MSDFKARTRQPEPGVNWGCLSVIVLCALADYALWKLFVWAFHKFNGSG
jgi:hypothetical protein